MLSCFSKFKLPALVSALSQKETVLSITWIIFDCSDSDGIVDVFYSEWIW